MFEAEFATHATLRLKLLMVGNQLHLAEERAKSAERINRSFEKLCELNYLPFVLIDEDPTTPKGFPEGSHSIATYEISGNRKDVNIARIDKLLTTFFEAFPFFNYLVEPIDNPANV